MGILKVLAIDRNVFILDLLSILGSVKLGGIYSISYFIIILVVVVVVPFKIFKNNINIEKTNSA